MVDINIIELIGFGATLYGIVYLINRLHGWYQSIQELKYCHDKIESDYRCMRYKLSELNSQFIKMQYEKCLKRNKIKQR